MTKVIPVVERKNTQRILSFSAGLIVVTIIGLMLIVGRSLLIPLVIAIFIWHLLNTIHNGIQKLPQSRFHLPLWLSRILALMAVIILIKLLIDIIGNNVNEVIEASSRYQENLTNIFNGIDNYFHIKTLTYVNSFFASLSVQKIVVNIYGMFTTVTGSAVLIILYVLFLFVEQHFFEQKLKALFPQPTHRELVDNILTHIVRDTQTYLGLKTLLSLITASTSWIIMKIVGLDFAEFWALLIFFLNFIPNIGAIIATAFPSFLALIQFQELLPFVVITSGLTAIQFIVGNLIEPRFLGQSLNLSPLVILIALAFWGSIWGVLGMFLSVPITVMMMIVFAHFSATRPIAIMLSQDGLIHKVYEKL